MKAQIKKNEKHVITKFAFNKIFFFKIRRDHETEKQTYHLFFKLLQCRTAKEKHHLSCILDAVRLFLE